MVVGTGTFEAAIIGNRERLQYIVTGSSIQSMGSLISIATTGTVVLTCDAHEELIHHLGGVKVGLADPILHGDSPPVCAGFLLREVSESQGSRHPEPLSTRANDDVARITELLLSSKHFGELLLKFVPMTVQVALTHQSSLHSKDEIPAENRVVTCIFISINHGAEDNLIKVLNRSLKLVLSAFSSMGCTLRQAIVDDKGPVIIGAFGLPQMPSREMKRGSCEEVVSPQIFFLNLSFILTGEVKKLRIFRQCRNWSSSHISTQISSRKMFPSPQKRLF